MNTAIKKLLLNADFHDQEKVFTILQEYWKGTTYIETGVQRGSIKHPEYMLLSKPEYSTNRKLLGCLCRNKNMLYQFMLNTKDKNYVVLEKY